MKRLLQIAVISAAPFVFSSCEKAKTAGDTSFARSTFQSLANGDADVQSKIDWQTLYANGINAGAAYIALPSDAEKQNFRTSFVSQFSANFRQNGGSVDEFKDWRVTFHDSLRTEVAADSATHGVLKLTVSERDSVKRLSSIDVVK